MLRRKLLLPVLGYISVFLALFLYVLVKFTSLYESHGAHKLASKIEIYSNVEYESWSVDQSNSMSDFVDPSTGSVQVVASAKVGRISTVRDPRSDSAFRRRWEDALYNIRSASNSIDTATTGKLGNLIEMKRNSDRRARLLNGRLDVIQQGEIVSGRQAMLWIRVNRVASVEPPTSDLGRGSFFVKICNHMRVDLAVDGLAIQAVGGNEHFLYLNDGATWSWPVVFKNGGDSVVNISTYCVGDVDLIDSINHPINVKENILDYIASFGGLLDFVSKYIDLKETSNKVIALAVAAVSPAFYFLFRRRKRKKGRSVRRSS